MLRLAPAAAAVDEQTTLLLSGSGWRRDEEVAICASAANNGLCERASALRVVQADRHGAIETNLIAGPLLGQGMTTFIASGLELGQVATRLFRVLKTANGQAAVALRWKQSCRMALRLPRPRERRFHRVSHRQVQAGWENISPIPTFPAPLRLPGEIPNWLSMGS